MGWRERTLLRRDRIGVVFQAFNLLPALTAADNIVLPSVMAGRPVDPEVLAGWWPRLGWVGGWPPPGRCWAGPTAAARSGARGE